MKKGNLLMQAFDEPNHTQTPNKFFDMMPDMSEAELRVTLVMIRHTLGYHKNTFKMGMKKLGDASGLTRQGAMTGAEAAEKRGIFKRSNPDSKKEAEWELVLLPVNVDDMSTSLTPSVNVDDTQCNLGLPQSRVKENYKENNKEKKGSDIFGFMAMSEDLKNKQSMDEIEKIAVSLEAGLRFNFPRGTKDQAVYRRILKSGKPIERFIEWVKSDEKRLSYAFLYAKDTETIWRDWPQVDNVSMNPQGLEIGL